MIAKAIVTLMDLPQPWVLSLDRTNWSFGQIDFNILMLTVVHEGVGYPLMWTFLDKKGNSNTEERMDLLNRFEREFPEVEVAYLCGDREFIGKPWLTYLLLDPIIRFRLRIRETDLISDGQKKFPAKTVFAHLQPGQQEILNSRRWGGRDARMRFGHFSRPFWGRLVYVSALRLEDGELLIVISPDSPETAISDYANRWGIETLFGMFKTRGFCLESTHFTDPQRLSKLLALMSLAMCWAMKVGEWLHSHTPLKVRFPMRGKPALGSHLKVKKHGRREKSLFRYGLDHLRSVVNDLDIKHHQFLECLQFLSCT